MDGDAKGREGRGACIAGQAFSPGETPMSPLCPSDDVFVGHRRWFLRGSGLHHDNCFAPEHLEPVAADVTTGPVSQRTGACGSASLGLGGGEGEVMGGAEGMASCEERGKITALTRRGLLVEGLS